jgi:hypothetical protein
VLFLLIPRYTITDIGFPPVDENETYPLGRRMRYDIREQGAGAGLGYVSR